MSGHYIHVDLNSPQDATDFEELTQEFHDTFKPGQQVHYITGPNPQNQTRKVSKDGFFETLHEMAGQQPKMTAVACIDQLRDPSCQYGIECFVTLADQPA